MSLIQNLSKDQQLVINQLSKFRQVSYDRVTGLVESIKADWLEANPDYHPLDWHYDTNEVNSQRLPGQLLPLQFSHTVIDQIYDNRHIRVSVGVREADTRVGIHVHESGGTTFVIDGDGVISDFVEGYADTFKPQGHNSQGHYYYMPPGLPMSAANLSNQPVVLMDIFVTPIGSPPITIIEPGYPGYAPI